MYPDPVSPANARRSARFMAPRFIMAPLVITAAIAVVGPVASSAPADGVSHRAARKAIRRAVTFFRNHAACEGGGYVYRVTADLSQREGESKTGPSTAWLEPPGTPAVGVAYLDAYRTCGDRLLLDAALETGNALVRGQLVSGGWANLIEFDPRDRERYAYRVDPERGMFNVTTLDDDKSQSATRFLMRLDQTLGFENETIHEAAEYALDALLKAQYANGAWPQRFSEFPNPDDHQPRPASLPEQWPREFPKPDYKGFYTLNDNTLGDVIDTMLLAHTVYDDPRHLESALRGGRFLLLAQLPEPQPGWAQQYGENMHPRWARKFEPAAVTGGESQAVMRILLKLYRVTGDEAFLDSVEKALAYYRRVELPGGQLARFYELGTDRPLYFTKDYELTGSDRDMPTHYAFKVSSKLDRIEDELKKLRERPWKPLDIEPYPHRGPKPDLNDRLAKEAKAAIESLDARGAWVEPGKMRTHRDPDRTQPVIDSRTFAERIRLLARYVAATVPD